MKVVSVSLLIIAQIAVMSLWFVSASVLPDMLAEVSVSATRQALLSSGVQAGFVVGALVSASLALPDRFDPRLVFVASALLGALANALLLIVPIGGDAAITLRFLTGALLAGVYPVGMKIAVGWGTRDRGWLVGLLVGALTLGSASPYLFAYYIGAQWQVTVTVSSVIAAIGALLVPGVRLGPHHQTAKRFTTSFLRLAWTEKPIRLAVLGYLGHMWELYAMWSWIAVASATSFALTMAVDDAQSLAKLAAFVAIASGGLASVIGGYIADRIGKAELTIIAMVVSGSAALLTALSFGGPVWLTFALVIVWGFFIVPDSAQFSALVADYSPPESAGSIMTLQTALGFALTIATVQIAPVLANKIGWDWVIASLALGPVFGIWAMLVLRGWIAEHPVRE